MKKKKIFSFDSLGFLYVSKENRGDYALQDIYTALHWLKNSVSQILMVIQIVLHCME